MNSNKRTPATPLGGAFLLGIFSVLCLLIFSILTLQTAMAEKRLSDQAASAVESYYHADLQAEEIFAQIRKGEIPNGVTEQNGIYTYSCRISAGMDLNVMIQKINGDWTVLQWKAVSSNQ